MTTLAVITAPRDDKREPTEWLQWLPGERVAIRVASDITHGSYTMVEVEAGPRSGPPLHVHQNEDEHFIVLEGVVHIVCGERSVDVPAGMTLTVPRGVPHAWANLSDAPARMLAIFSPGGIEDFSASCPRWTGKVSKPSPRRMDAAWSGLRSAPEQRLSEGSPESTRRRSALVRFDIRHLGEHHGQCLAGRHRIGSATRGVPGGHFCSTVAPATWRTLPAWQSDGPTANSPSGTASPSPTRAAAAGRRMSVLRKPPPICVARAGLG